MPKGRRSGWSSACVRSNQPPDRALVVESDAAAGGTPATLFVASRNDRTDPGGPAAGPHPPRRRIEPWLRGVVVSILLPGADIGKRQFRLEVVHAGARRGKDGFRPALRADHYVPQRRQTPAGGEIQTREFLTERIM